jgi:hypothetical protein
MCFPGADYVNRRVSRLKKSAAFQIGLKRRAHLLLIDVAGIQ